MDKVCVLIRVYNRIEDLKYCVDIIRDTWKTNDYYVIVVANGETSGYIVDEDTKSKIDKFINLTDNVGHFNGNSQLLLAGLNHIPEYCEYTLILEADTWMFSDHLITEYIQKLKSTHAVWASAQFFRYVANLATDFAIVKTSFVKSNPDIFTFSGTPEYFVANFLLSKDLKFIYINENMPISLPKYLKRYPFAPTGRRFFSFERSKMVTHHIETLKHGIEQKKYEFNVVSKTNYFNVDEKKLNHLSLSGLKLAKALSILLPYKGWFIRRKNSDV